MNEQFQTSLKASKWGLILILLTLIYGYGLGGYFGLKEGDIKSGLHMSAMAHLDDAYGGDMEKLKKITSKSWSYIKRAHFHANGIGTTAAVLALFLLCIKTSDRNRQIAILLLGIGGLGYSICWQLAGELAPSLGSTGAAKAHYALIARPTAAMALLGVVFSSFLIIQSAFSSDEEGK
ncbi:MAG: hypothetical protein QNL04_01160 [SAR324 cluster bacterium]|nr:hypothetical protein [SAR324 cluster bacterium]